jgi:hypothetical protein
MANTKTFVLSEQPGLKDLLNLISTLHKLHSTGVKEINVFIK